jgi:hypothetical protein
MGDDYSVRLLRRLTHTPLALKDTLGDKLYDAYISSMLTPFSIDEVRLMERKTLYQVSTKCGDDKTFYRFGFNGQEKDNELKGKGNVNTAEFWEYDTRLGRRWNIDPVDQISISNYACFGNNPILNTDVRGDSTNNSSNSIVKLKNLTVDVVKSTPQLASSLYNESCNTLNLDKNRVSQGFNGAANLTFGVLGTIGSIAYIGGTEGGGAPLGGAAALTLSLGEVSMGFTQLISAISGKQTDNESLHNFATPAGMAMNETQFKEYAPLVDASAGMVPAVFGGGNLNSIGDAINNVIKNPSIDKSILKPGLELTDAALDNVGFAKESTSTVAKIQKVSSTKTQAITVIQQKFINTYKVQADNTKQTLIKPLILK